MKRTIYKKLLEKGRIVISCTPEDWLNAAFDLPKLRLINLSPVLAYRSTVLPPPFHDDPADQIRPDEDDAFLANTHPK